MWQIIGFAMAVTVGIWVGVLILKDNRSRTAALEKLIEELQGRVKELEWGAEITSYLDTEKVWVPTVGFFGLSNGVTIDQPRKIKLIDAVKAIFDHFGLDLRFQKGAPATPERLVLQKKPKGK